MWRLCVSVFQKGLEMVSWTHYNELKFIRVTRSFGRSFIDNLKTRVYPAPLYSYYLITVLLGACYSAGMDFSFGLIDFVRSFMFSNCLLWHVVSCIICTLVIWHASILLVRFALKLLLRYKGWLYERTGPGSSVSLQTKLWGMSVKAIIGTFNSSLYAYQGCLPALPVPSINDTITKYLRSARAYMDDERFSCVQNAAKDFQKDVSGRLQMFLYLKSWFKPNYVTDWWEEYAYLRNRSPIMVNSNVYCFDAIYLHTTNIQAARAACVTQYLLQVRALIDSHKLEPIIIQKMIPLCQWQYKRVFNTTRIPGETTDTLQHLNYSNHIVVIHKGRYFKVPLYKRGVLLKQSEIERQYEMILADGSQPEPGEEHLGSLTADSRTTWAKLRKQYISKGMSNVSLTTIEKAAFVVILEDMDFEYDLENSGKLTHYAGRLFHGSGSDRWFDKSFNLIVSQNGRLGYNTEHSWGDGPIVSHCLEWILGEEVIQGYAEDGHTKGYPCAEEPPSPIRLKWEFEQTFLPHIEESYKRSQSLINNVDHQLYIFNGFGSTFIKKCEVSPDAYIHMALQLTYYRDAGCFCPTYESSMTRLFLQGRTETVRPCTVESCDFVKSMEDETIPTLEKISLFRCACAVHQRSYQDAMCGKGVDRHLFALYVASKYFNIDSPFLTAALGDPWLLSTSQTPCGQSHKVDWKNHPTVVPLGGGFGAVTPDGYGISYGCTWNHIIYFHISSFKSSTKTDTNRFIKLLKKSLHDLAYLFDEQLKNNNNKLDC